MIDVIAVVANELRHKMIELTNKMMRVVILVAILTSYVGAATTPLFPAMFTFGDSLLDVGNNNYLASAMAKANAPPNGIDFPNGVATGRFCNGKTLVDIIAEGIGLEYAPPALAPTSRGEQILQGVNYASGAAGILDESGDMFVEYLSASMQVVYFNRTVVQLQELLGESKAKTLLAKSLFFVSLGTNDFLYNYLLPNSEMAAKYTLPQYYTFLAAQFEQLLKKMYNLGARKFVINSIGQIGCMPARISMALTTTRSLNGSCVASENEIAAAYNAALQEMLPRLTGSWPGSMFLYANSFHSGTEIMQNAAQQGFEVVYPGCCAFRGAYKGTLPCGLLNDLINALCKDRLKYIFWDEFHPTEAVNILMSKKLFSGSTEYISPMNLYQLSQWTS